jgi:hypothetical protein
MTSPQRRRENRTRRTVAMTALTFHLDHAVGADQTKAQAV